MLKNSLLLWLCVTVSIFAQAQNLQHIWSHTMGDGLGEDDESYTMCTDDKGNLYVAGIFEGYIDFDPDPNKLALLGSSGDHGYIAKYDSTGKLFWVKQIESLSSIQINEIALDNSGNVLIAGYYSNRIDFDPSPDTSYAYSGTFNNANGFAAKYSNSGELIWGLNIGGNSVDNATCLAIADDNSVVVAGAYSDTVDFNPGSAVNQQIAVSDQDIFIAKYDSAGAHQWAFGVGASINDYAQKVEIDKNGDIVVAGTFSNTADFDPSSNTANLSRNGRNDAFIAKYTSGGSYKWAKTIGGSGNEYVYGMKISSTNQIYLSGIFENTADFDPSSSTANLSSNGRDDIFIAKYQPDGSYTWAKNIGSSSDESVNSLALDSKHNCYISGYFVAQTDFDPSSSTSNFTPVGNGDIYIAKYDSTGGYEYVNTIGDKNFENAFCLATDNYGGLWAGGTFAEIVDFDPGTAVRNLSTPERRNNSSFFARYKQSNGAYDTAWTILDRLGGDDEILDICHDSKGNVYATGYFNGSIDFDPSAKSSILNSKGGFDIFLAKYDAKGDYLWSFNLGAGNNDVGQAITVDSKDNVYITGFFVDTIDLDPSTSSAQFISNGFTEIFMAKYDPNGNYKWGHTIGGRSSDVGYGIATDSSNNVWVTGYFRSTVDFDPGTGTTNLTARNYDAFITKYDQYGNYKLAKFIGGSSNNFGYSLVNGTDNCVFVTGEFRNTCDFDPSSSTANLRTSGTADPFIAKYDSLGQYIWAIGMFGSGSDQANDIDIDENENVYIGGQIQNSNDFDPSSSTRNLVSGGSDDAFVASYTSNGNYRWAYNFGSSINRNDQILSLDVEGVSVVVTGYFGDTVDFNPSSSDSIFGTNNADNPFVLKLDTSGGFIEAAHLPASKGYAHAVTVYENSTYVGGAFQSIIDLDPSAKTTELKSSKGVDDIFIALLSKPCIAASNTISVSVCGPYKAPSGNKFYHKSGTYIDTLLTAEGCDSLLTINLTIKNSFNSISELVCDSFKAPSGKVFYKSGIYLDTITNSQNCDSIISINLTLQNNSSKISVTACDTFYSPSGKYKYTKSGTYFDTLLNKSNCDSVIEIELVIKNSSFNTLILNACDSFISPSQKYVYKSTGLYFDTLINKQGCDSIIALSLSVNSTKSNKINPSVCSFYVSPTNKTYAKSGVYFDTLQTFKGCDSIVEIDLNIKPASNNSITLTHCNSFVSPSKKYTFTKSGVYLDTLVNWQGCDSVLTINLTINETTSLSISLTSCDSLRSPSGKYLYTQSGTYTDTLTNWKGCDSIITINATINQTQRSKINASVCGAYTSPSNKTFSTSGTYFDTIATANNCDSIIEIELTVRSASAGFDTLFVCDSLVSPSGKFIYKQNGVYTDTLINAQGCDSVITLNVKIDIPSFKSLTLWNCDSVTSPSGKYTYTKSGVYWDTIPVTVGCDSVFRLTVFVYETKYSTIDSASCDPMRSPSGNYTYSTTGVYYDTLKTKWRCDSIITINYERFEASKTSFEITACDEYTIPGSNYTFYKSGVYKDTFTNSNGCDSIVTIELTIIDNNPKVNFSNNTLSVDLDSLKYQWLNCETDFAKIDTATRQKFRPTKSGEYTAVVFEESCADTAACLDVVIVGKEDVETNEISVYPNPVNDVLFVSSKTQIESIKIYDATGKLMTASTKVDNGMYKVVVSHWPKALYHLEVTTTKGVKRTSFMKS
ncbi:MAG: T9SS type A sorting domain-containing protein [Bacteroidia bacterium]